MHRAIKYLIWIPVIFMAVIIFGFSGQNGNESGGLSRKAAKVILTAADSCNIVFVTEENEEQYIENLQFPIRKAAHMTEYAMLALLCLLALTVDGVGMPIRYIGAVAMSFVFACTDEFHQLYVPDRSGKFTDVLIDTMGCLIAVGIVFCVHKVRERKDSV